MVLHGSELNQQDEKPEFSDDGWWASVFADEGEEINGTRSDNKESQIQVSDSIVVDWEKAKLFYDDDEVISMTVCGCNKGGLLVSGNGIQGFVPSSHLIDIPGSISDTNRRELLMGYIGSELKLKVIECEPIQERIVLSERAALAGDGKRKFLFQTLKPGSCINGVVTNVTEFGVFVDLGGVEGLIHVSELSWGRVQHPEDVLHIGEEVRTLVLSVNEETSRVALSLKKLHNNPWDGLSNRYHPGDILPATITTIKRFGAFARLPEGIEGLIHISSIPLLPDCKSLEKFLYTGQTVQVEILHLDGERRRLGLGLVTSR